MKSVPRLVYAAVVCVLLAAIRPVHAYGQEDPLQEDWRWVRYGVESGLPSERLLGLVESAGTLWVATYEGMAWFDGYRWNAVTVPGLEMQAWVDQRDSDARSTWRMAPDYGGGVYLATSGPLYHVEQGRSEVIPLMFDGAPLAVTSVATTGPDEVYVVAGPTVFAWDGNLITELPALPPEPLANDGLLTIAGGGGKLWAQRGRAEPLFELRDSSWLPRMTPASAEGSSAILEASPYSTLLKSRGELGDEVWISGPTGVETHRGLVGTRHVDAASVSPRGDVVIAYRLGRIEVRRAGQWRELARGAGPYGIDRLRFVANGDLWVDSRSGLFLNRSAQRWVEDSELEALAPVVLSVLPATTGDLWVGDASALVVRRSDGTVERLSSILGTSLAPVTGLAEDREGGIWVSSGGGFDGAFRWFAGRWRHYGPEQGLGTARVHQIVPDREGRLWFLGIGPRFGIDERGAFVFDGDTFVRWSTAEGLLDDRVYDFTEGPDGTRWFATGGGLSRWREDVWTHWTIEDGVRGPPFTLALDGEGRLWFGHGDVTRGLGFVDAADRVSYVQPTDVLASRHVWDLALGPDSALWVSTQSGLGVIRKGEHAFLGAKEGLDDLTLWPLVPMRDRVLVGTLGGGLVELVTSEASSPPPVVSARTPLIDQSTVLLRWDATAYNGQQSSEDIPTRYRIDDEDWSSWGTAREFGPVVLTAGRHRLDVQAKGLFAAVGQVESVAFRIVPPFYRRPLFLALGALWLALSLAWAGVFWRRERRARAHVTEREAYFRSLIENASDLISVIDQTGHIQYQSPSSLTILGYSPEERVGRSMFDLLHPEDEQAAREALRSVFLSPGNARTSTVRLRHKDGGWRTLEVTGAAHTGGDGKPIAVIHARDVTERERLNAQLRQAQKMEVVGQLTGGIAHDFNNLLTVISGNLELARIGMEETDPVNGLTPRDLTKRALDAAGRARDLTQRLLAFSRKQPLRPRAVDLNELLDGIGTLLRRTLGEDFTTRIVHKPGLWKCDVDPAQMENAVLNLAINSRDAMQQGGRLTIETENIWLSADSVPQFPDLTPGPYVRCTIQDDGSGMTSAVLERIIEPFFTTKDVGLGSGLGMSMVYGFVKQTGGDLMIESVVGEGTSVSLFLPRAGDHSEEREQPLAALPEPQGSGEMILVVEDDESVRELTVTMLTHLGYTTIEAEDGPSAIRALAAVDQVDLLFTDMVLPGGMSGVDIAALAVEARPELEVLYVSGYTKDEIGRKGQVDPRIPLLQKPFTKSELARHVREVLEARRT